MYFFQTNFSSKEWAQKSAGHELKGTLEIIACYVENLHVPLMALVNYRGYRIIVTSVLPVGEDTLIYGRFQVIIIFNWKLNHFSKLFNQFKCWYYSSYR